MSKKKKRIILSVAVVLFVILGIYFCPPIHVPTRILGFRVTFIDDFAFEDLGTDAVILSVPEGIDAMEIYHKESQCYYTLFSQSEAKVNKYVGNKKKVEFPQEVW